MTLVKICGVSDPKHARAAAAFGADFVGMVFAPSRRQVTLGQAKRIAAALGKKPGERLPAGDVTAIEAAIAARRPLLVGVFADQDADTINAIATEVGLDLVQLSGSEPWEVNEHIERPVLKCMKVRAKETAPDVLQHYHGGAVLLLDPYVEGTYGGTGQTLDWNVAGQIARQTPTVLAGGLTPDNVAEAVRTVHPWAVDVSSGVETDGVKDNDKIRSFIMAAKSADTPATAPERA
ncbi:MAG TPA: phosphoribosylanthranilate isomerase [Dehalococcoidia bacterium]|jgi:phosphoribosylanthranilate isomerase|nr:phosphoribosylanthranilate isomerase [Dehalococcoidia bacterium]